MNELDELILLEEDGVQGRYFCSKNNSIVEAIGTIAVPRSGKDIEYRGTVIWSNDISATLQVKAAKRVCKKYCNMSDKELLEMARKHINWSFGEFYGVEASKILQMSKEYNINVEMRDIDTGEMLEL